MALLRSAEKKDVAGVMVLAKALNSYNLPFDRKVIRDLVRTSIRSFQGKLPKSKAKYLFVIEEPSSKKIFGVSLIIARQGTPQDPHIYLERHREKKKTYLKFGSTTHGPTEIGGLVLRRPYRRRRQKFGKQLSWIRFLYMARHPERFESRVLAEFLPPLQKGKGSLFWDVVGKPFTGLSYREADRLSVYSKDFVFSFFPKGKIDTARLPKRVRRLLGTVAREARPACRMLQEIGFRTSGRIEPFDGGPYYEAKRRNIAVIRKVKTFRFQKKEWFRENHQALFLLERKGRVRSCVGRFQRQNREFHLDEATQKLLGPKKGDMILFVPL